MFILYILFSLLYFYCLVRYTSIISKTSDKTKPQRYEGEANRMQTAGLATSSDVSFEDGFE